MCLFVILFVWVYFIFFFFLLQWNCYIFVWTCLSFCCKYFVNYFNLSRQVLGGKNPTPGSQSTETEPNQYRLSTTGEKELLQTTMVALSWPAIIQANQSHCKWPICITSYCNELNPSQTPIWHHKFVSKYNVNYILVLF